MSTFYIDLLSIFFLFLTALTCFFAIFRKSGLYWILPFIAASILCIIRIIRILDPQTAFTTLTGTSLYIEMLTPTALLILFLSSLFLRYGIKNRETQEKKPRPSLHPMNSFDDDHIALKHDTDMLDEILPTQEPVMKDEIEQTIDEPVVETTIPVVEEEPLPDILTEPEMETVEEPVPEPAPATPEPEVVIEPEPVREPEPVINGGNTTEKPYTPSTPSPTVSIETRQIELFFDKLNEVTSTQKIRKDDSYLYITGIKHSGKTTKGRLAAEKLGYSFHDLDELILELCEFSPLSDLTIREIYNTVGKERFMLLEYATMHQFLYLNQQESADKPKHIIALGGGVCDNITLIEMLKWTGHMIYIEAEESVLYSRIIRNGIPPFLDAEDPERSFHEVFERRDGCYREGASIKVKTSPDSPIEEGVEKLLSAIEQIEGSTT